MLDQVNLVMTELHSRICSAYQGGRALAWRILLIGYYCRRFNWTASGLPKPLNHASIMHAHQEGRQHFITQLARLSHLQHGGGYTGPFRQLAGRKKFVIVAIDYFSKWVEAEALATVKSQQCARFLWRKFVSRFGVSIKLVTDMGSSLKGNIFRIFLRMSARGLSGLRWRILKAIFRSRMLIEPSWKI